VVSESVLFVNNFGTVNLSTTNEQHYQRKGAWESVVPIVNRIQAGRSDFRIPVGTRDFALLQNIQTVPVAHLSSYTMGTGLLSRGVKPPDHDVYHSPPSSDEITNEWSCTSTPLACLFFLTIFIVQRLFTICTKAWFPKLFP